MTTVQNSDHSCTPTALTVRALLDTESIALEELAFVLRALEDTIEGYQPHRDDPLTRVRACVVLLQREVARIATMHQTVYAQVCALDDMVQAPQEDGA